MRMEWVGRLEVRGSVEVIPMPPKEYHGAYRAINLPFRLSDILTTQIYFGTDCGTSAQALKRSRPQYPQFGCGPAPNSSQPPQPTTASVGLPFF